MVMMMMTRRRANSSFLAVCWVENAYVPGIVVVVVDG